MSCMRATRALPALSALLLCTRLHSQSAPASPNGQRSRMSNTFDYLYDCASTTLQSLAAEWRSCRSCMRATRALPALRCYCAHDYTLNQPLSLPTVNSAACLTHSTTARLRLHHAGRSPPMLLPQLITMEKSFSPFHISYSPGVLRLGTSEYSFNSVNTKSWSITFIAPTLSKAPRTHLNRAHDRRRGHRALATALHKYKY
jgi:hypothetical protein